MILQGNVMNRIKDLPFVDCIVSSPPYYGIRNYGKEATTIWDGNNDCEHEWGEKKHIHGTRNDNWVDSINPKKGNRNWDSPSNFCNLCNAWKGQLGHEPTPQLYIKHLVQVFEALKPKLADYGSLWINIGDTYSGGGNALGHTAETTNAGKTTLDHGYIQNPVTRNLEEFGDKNLLLIPHRFAIAMQESGWIVRSDIHWHKNNPMPEPVKDRFTRDHEYVFLFTKKKKYYFEQQFETQSDIDLLKKKRIKKPHKWENQLTGNLTKGFSTYEPNPLGRNMRTTWTINIKGYKDAHFAVFPEELVEVPIKAGCPEKVCIKCNKPIIKENIKVDEFQRRWSKNNKEGSPYEKQSSMQNIYKTQIIKCSCGAKFRKGIVLDPFLGSGTVAVVAENQGKDFVGIEINSEYVEIAKKRIDDNRIRLARLQNIKKQQNRI